LRAQVVLSAHNHFLIGPLMGGLIWDRAGPPVAFASFAVIYGVTIALVIILLREQPRSSEAA